MATVSSKASDTILSSYRVRLPLGPVSAPRALPIALPRLDNLPGFGTSPIQGETALAARPDAALLDHRHLSHPGRAAGDPAADRSQ